MDSGRRMDRCRGKFFNSCAGVRGPLRLLSWGEARPRVFPGIERVPCARRGSARLCPRRRISTINTTFQSNWASMPICEADPWRLQFFERVDCPPDVNIPTEDSDAWLWFPDHRWVYDKVAIALSQGLDAGPHGVPPPRFPVFSKPITNLKGMGIA